MNNYLKLTSCLVLTLLLCTISCKKESVKPNSEPIADKSKLVTDQKRNNKQELNRKEFAVYSRTFKAGQVDLQNFRRKIHRPHISWGQLPVGTKTVWIILDDDHNHSYWASEASVEATIIDEVSWEQSSPQKFKFPTTKSNVAVLEVFALSCTPDEFISHLAKKVDTNDIPILSRSALKNILKEQKLSHLILASCEAKYTVKAN